MVKKKTKLPKLIIPTGVSKGPKAPVREKKLSPRLVMVSKSQELVSAKKVKKESKEERLINTILNSPKEEQKKILDQLKILFRYLNLKLTSLSGTTVQILRKMIAMLQDFCDKPGLHNSLLVMDLGEYADFFLENENLKKLVRMYVDVCKRKNVKKIQDKSEDFSSSSSFSKSSQPQKLTMFQRIKKFFGIN